MIFKLAAILLFLSAPALAAVTEIKLLVNGKPISNFDIEQQALMLIVTSNLEPTKENKRRARERAKTQLIDNVLRTEIAKQNRILITKEEVDKAIRRNLDNKQSVQSFLAFLEKNNVHRENFYYHMEAELLWNKYIERHIVPKIIVPQNQVEQKLQQMRQNLQQKSYLLSQLVLRFDNQREEKKVKTTIGALKQQLSKGAAFDVLARNYSHDSSARSGGDLGWVAAGDLPKKLRRVVQAMKINSISPVIRLADGFYIVLLRDIQAPLSQSLKKTMLDLKIIRVPPSVSNRQAKKSFSNCNNTNASAETLGGEVEAMGLVPLTDLSSALQKKLRRAEENTLVASINNATQKEFILVCGKIIQDDPRLSQQKIQNTLLSQQAFIRARQKLRDLRRNASIETK